jgi:hypothetical protein
VRGSISYTVPVRWKKIPLLNPEILSIRVLKKRWIKTEIFPLSVSVMKLHSTIKAFSAAARLSKIAHIYRKSVQNPNLPNVASKTSDTAASLGFIPREDQ